MSQIHWMDDVSADFGTAADWTGSVVPGATDDAILDAAGAKAFTVTASTKQTVGSIQTAADATLAVTVGAGDGGFTAKAGSGAGVNAGVIAIADAGDFNFGGTLDNTGLVTLGSTGDATQSDISSSDATLAGGGAIELTDNANNEIGAAAAGDTLINMANTISGAGTIGGGGLKLVNGASGVIDATGTLNALTLGTGTTTIVNAGLIEATGAGGLTIDGVIHNASTGSIEVLDGSNINVASATIIGGALVAGNGVTLNLANFTLSGVRLETQGTGSFDANGGSLNGGGNGGDLVVAPGTDLDVSGVLDNSGVISLITDNNGGENGTQMVLTGSTSLTGGGAIVLGGTTPWADAIDPNSTPPAPSTGMVLTNVNETIEGSGYVEIGQQGSCPLNIVNDADGVIDGDGASTTLTLLPGGGANGSASIVNEGLIEGTGAAGLTISGAAVYNAGGRILAANGSQVDLNNNAAIIGGVVTSGGNGAIDIKGGASLNTLTNAGSVDVDDGDTLYLGGTLTNTGAIILAAGGHGANLQMFGVVTLTGGGKVEMVDAGGAPNANSICGNFYAASGANLTLINVNNVISGAGSIGNGSLGGKNLTIVNDANGVFDATDAGTALTLFDPTSGAVITNLGLMEGTGAAGLVFSSSVDNAGGRIVAGNGSQVVVNNNADIAGGVLATGGSGVIYADGAAFSALTNKGNVVIGNGDTLYLGGTLTNQGVVTLAADGNGAALTMSGAVTLTGGGKVKMADTGGAPNANAISGALTNVNNTIYGAGNLGNGGTSSIVNDAGGVIDATDAGTALILDVGAPGSITNLGLIEATGAAGLAITGTSVINAGGVILAAKGSQVDLESSEVTGGVLETSGTGAIDIGTATFANLTNEGKVSVVDGDALYLAETFTNTGTVSLAGAGHGANLIASGKVTLTGAGTVAMGGTTPWANQISGGELINAGSTIAGAGAIGTGGSSLTFLNQSGGVIDATNASVALTINTGNNVVAFTNHGLIEATGAGGVTITGTAITNNAGTISAGVGSNITLNNNSGIAGGTVTSVGTGVVDISGGASFSNLATGADVAVLDGDVLYVGGTIRNTGVISIQGGAHGGGVQISGAVTLTGSGSVTLGGASPWDSFLAGNTYDSTQAVLTNESTINGQGHIGSEPFGRSTYVINGANGVIDGANGGYGLYLDNTGTAIANQGLIEATTGGLTIINETVDNTGKIYADGGTVQVNAGISGGGGVYINGGTMDFTLSGVANNVTFLGRGVLLLAASQSYAGTVTGFSKTGTNSLDLADISFVGPSEATFVENAGGTSGVLTVTNGGATATITLIGDYAGSKFVTSEDATGGTIVTDPAPAPHARTHAFVAAMATVAPPSHATIAAAATHHDHPVLAAAQGRAV